jgi:ankyrin repeat protein
MSLLGKDNKGNTALILASQNGHESTVKALLAAGADIEGK